MKGTLKFALLLGVMALTGSIASAQTPGVVDGRNARSADVLLRNFDFNRDGRITRDELNRTIGWRFASATSRAAAMTFEEFLSARAEAFRQRNVEAFRALDWNGDGKLTLAEFSTGQRARFTNLDQEGRGFVSCAVVARGGRQGVISSFCAESDTNMDGRVGRAELDTALAKRFALATNGSGTMTLSQFILSEQQRFALSNARAFRRLDADGDGTLTVQEYGSPDIKAFARLDRNHNGILEVSELHPRVVVRADRQRRRYD